VKVFSSYGNQNSLFEDICAFGWGRIMLGTSDLLGGDHNGNTFRRVWTRFEGYLATQGSFILEPEYYHTEPPTSGNDRYENFIAIYSGERDTSTSIGRTGLNKQGLSLPDTKHGFILYEYATAVTPRDGPLWNEKQTNTASGSGVSFTSNIVDGFVDGRGSAVQAVNFLCSGNAGCASNSADRLTVIRHSSAPDSNFTNGGTATNTNECTTLSACPNFYTGDSPGTGARNCYEYTDGVLGTASTQRLWPWRMDDRIKAALARANAAGTGGTALSGTAGSGYAANTVTSEIVSRYGAIPASCLR
jgi:hypothetical protein